MNLYGDFFKTLSEFLLLPHAPLKQLKFKTLFVPPWVATFKHAIERFLQ